MDYSAVKQIALNSMGNTRTRESYPISDAVRISLGWFAKEHPGKSVEVRVPPYMVVQVLEGVNHRRGKPAAVVEITAPAWLRLISGKSNWNQEISFGTIQASGERSNLGDIIATTISD